MFGDFLRNYKSLNYSDLHYKDSGTPIVIKRSAHMYQFGIYGNNNVIFQHCFFIGSIIFFCIEECSAKKFCTDGQLYEYTPQYDFDKSSTYAHAEYYYQLNQMKAIPASVELRSVYGDDFTLICMVGHKAFTNAFHHSKMGGHYYHSFYMAGMAPAQHHLLAIEEGFVIHFSRGDNLETPQIIIEEFEHVEERAYEKWDSCLIPLNYNYEDTVSRLKARNRALLVFAGFVRFGNYELMTNNCEHFVRWCKTGKACSRQVTNFFIDAASIFASIIFKNPAPLMTRIAQRNLFFD